MTDEKKFGLVIPKKIDAFKKKKSIFEDDSDEDENVYKRPKIPQKKLESKNKLNINLVEDPSIYEYDDIYDEMKRKQTEIIAPKEKKNSRYIETLLKAAEKRKKEYERRIDRKIQVEREKEGDKYKDKEAFVTSSYKKKMLEQEEEEEKERRENILNDMMDVTKQNDLSGFYRHFLKQTVGEEKIPQFGGRQIKEDIVSNEDSSIDQKSLENYENADQDSDNIESDDNKSPEIDGKLHTENQKVFSGCEIQNMKQSSSKSESKTSHFKKRSRKHYRKSKKSPSFRSSSSEEDGNLHNDKNNLLCTGKKSDKNLLNSRHDSCSSDDDDDNKLNGKSADTDDCSKDRKEKNFKIFAKRTIGNNFTEAQARYFQRMASQKAEI